MSPDSTIPSILLMLGVLSLVFVIFRRARGKAATSDRVTRRGPGPGAMGAVYGMLNEDKRNAVEIIVEERAGARDPEDRDGNLPDLEAPGGR